jgi:hypothetical protein
MNDPQPEGHMASYIERRKFLATLGGTAVAWPLGALGQQSKKLPTIGCNVRANHLYETGAGGKKTAGSLSTKHDWIAHAA